MPVIAGTAFAVIVWALYSPSSLTATSHRKLQVYADPAGAAHRAAPDKPDYVTGAHGAIREKLVATVPRR